MVTPQNEEIPAARTPSISRLITERFSNKIYFYLNDLKEPWQRSLQSPPPEAPSAAARASTLALLARQSGTALKRMALAWSFCVLPSLWMWTHFVFILLKHLFNRDMYFRDNRKIWKLERISVIISPCRKN